MVRIQEFTTINNKQFKLDQYKDIVIVELDNIKFIEITTIEHKKLYYPLTSIEYFTINNIVEG